MSDPHRRVHLEIVLSAGRSKVWPAYVPLGVPLGPQARDAIIASLAPCADTVPAEVPVGLHLCYGDWGHQHFKQPESLALQVRVLNEVAAAAGRALSFASFTVPQYQRAESYFAPLAARSWADQLRNAPSLGR